VPFSLAYEVEAGILKAFGTIQACKVFSARTFIFSLIKDLGFLAPKRTSTIPAPSLKQCGFDCLQFYCDRKELRTALGNFN
jgi:hypothetical protein